MLLLAACSGTTGPRAVSDPIKGFIGAVVSDEPQATLIGRDMLAAGGNAVDAAVAISFALGVTLPSQAGLGGGGVCLAFEQKSGEVRALDFLPEAPAAVPPSADRPSAIPAAARGLYTLHARFGRLPWSQLIAPSERLARFGAPVSRAFANDLQAVRNTLARESDLRRQFSTADGSRLVGEGDTVVQLELAATLSRLRSEGPAGLYTGPTAAAFATAVQAAGGSLDRADLTDYHPLWRETVRLKIGNNVAHFPPPPVQGGLIEAQILAMLNDGDRFRKAAREERDHLMAEVSARAFADAGRAGPVTGDPQSLLTRSHVAALMAGYRRDRRDESAFAAPPSNGAANPAATSVVAVDRDGNAVACGLTLNTLFGTGRRAAGTGILLAALPRPGSHDSASLGPMLVMNEAGPSFRFAAAASGGSAAPGALAGSAARILFADEPVSAAVNTPRVHAGGDAQAVLIESTVSPERAEALRQRGHPLAVTQLLGRVSAIACLKGLPGNPASCAAATDQRGFGFAIVGG